MADVFVSYARGDQQVARMVADRLAAAGFSVWWDTELLPHNRFGSVIEEQIDAARCVLVIWSQSATASPWVRGEAELGRTAGKLIQVATDESPIPLPFNQYQAADLTHWRGDKANPHWQKVLASVAHFQTQTNDAAKRVPTHPKRGPISRNAQLAIAGAVVLAVAGGGATLFRNVDRQPQLGALIAIQPFRTIGTAPGVADFAASLSDSLQNILTQDLLHTVSPAEADTLKGADLSEQAKKLHVGLLFSGTVQAKAGDIDVDMRIDDAVQQTSLWTAEMSAPQGQSDQLQARVGALTVAVLNCSQQGLAPGADLSDSALQAFLHACELSQTASHGSAGGSAAYAMLDAMRQAAREAPDFAGSHSMLAKHLAYAFAHGLAGGSDSLRAEAQSEAHRALELDPRDPDALVTFGLLAPRLDFARRESWFRKALAANPSWSHANGFLGNVMADVGRLQEALALYQRAASVNPLSADWAVVVPGALISVGQVAEANREMIPFAQRWPDDPITWYTQIDSMVAQKRWGDALKLLDGASALPSPPSADWLAGRRALFTALQSGDAAARGRLRQALLASSNGNPKDAIYQLAMLGFVDDAFALGGHYSPRSTDSPDFLFQPEVDDLRNDPRFMALASRFGLPAYWQRSRQWPDFCSDPHCRTPVCRLPRRSVTSDSASAA